MKLRMNDMNEWKCLNGNWKERNDGIFETEAGFPERQMYPLAFYLKYDFYIFKAEFSFRFTQPTQISPDAGLIFGAVSSEEFYMLHFPACIQATRSKNFWLAVSKMENGYLKLIDLQHIARIRTDINYWHNIKAEYDGNILKVAVDGRGFYELRAPGAGKGKIGLMKFSYMELQDVEIYGETYPASEFDVSGNETWFHPYKGTDHGSFIYPVTMLKNNGDRLLLYFTAHSEPYAGKTKILAVVSDDNGRTWSDAPEIKGYGYFEIEGLVLQKGTPHLTHDGRIICPYWEKNELYIRESSDDGFTWGDPVKIDQGGKLPENIYGSGNALMGCTLINLSDGKMAGAVYIDKNDAFSGGKDSIWGASQSQVCSYIVSLDERILSDIKNIDGALDCSGNLTDGCMDGTEVAMQEFENGCIKAYMRPGYSPWMWECESNTLGRSWEPAVYGPFPGYATSNLLKTASGKALIAARIPGTCIHLSNDGCRTWDKGTMIDAAGTVMGSMFEVEPDLILYAYFHDWESRMRAQFFRVTDNGLLPEIF